jgi:hypothetical protein
MTTINAAPDACQKCAQPWRPGELFCSACGTARSGTPTPRPAAEPTRPLVVLVAQVLMGLSIAANIFWLVFGVAALAALGPLLSSGGSSLAVAAVFDALLTFVYVVVMFRAQRGLGERRRSSRTVAAVFPAIDWILGLLVGALSGDTLAGGASWLVVGLPWAALIASLLWLPEDSRRWFRDLTAPGDRPPARDAQKPQGPSPADDGDRWAAEARRAKNAGNVPYNRKSSNPRPVEPPSTGRHARPAPTPAKQPSGVETFPSAPSFPSGPTPVVGKEPAVEAPRRALLPRAVPGAPQLDPEYGARLLARAGFPATTHNLFAVHERLAVMFRMRGLQFIGGLGTPDDRRLFEQRIAPGDDPYGWAQLVLNALVRWRADSSPHVQDFYERYSAMLLEDVGTGSGFFGGPRDEPLPTMDDWR